MEEQQPENDAHRQEESGVMTTTEKWKPSRQEALIMLTLAIVSLMVSLDATVIVTSLSTIARALDLTNTQGFWIGTSYLLANAVTMPFTAALSDVIGRPRCLFTAVLMFSVGTVLCARAQGIAMMLAGRCIQGVGGGGVIILSLVIFSDIVPLRFRPQYIGTIQGAWAIGTCIGPIVGGAFAHPDTWRWVFYVMFPFCATGLLFIPLFVRLKPRKATLTEMLRRIDWIGGFLFMSSATGFLIAVSWGGTESPWDHWKTLVPLIVGGVGIILTMVWERFGAREPFLRHSLFKTWSAHAVYAGAFAQGLLLYGQLYYVPFFFESVKFKSPIATGVALLPVLLILIPTSIIAGAVITRTGTYRWAIRAGWVFTLIGSGVLVSWSCSTPTAAWAVELIIVGVGHGFLLNALGIASQAVAQPGDEAAAVAMYAFLRTFGMATGVGVASSVFQNVMKSSLESHDLDVSIAYRAETFIEVLKTMSDESQRNAILDAYVHGFRGVFGFFTALTGLALVISLFIKHFDINKALTSEHKLDNPSRISWIRANKSCDLEVSAASLTEVPPVDSKLVPESDKTWPANMPV